MYSCGISMNSYVIHMYTYAIRMYSYLTRTFFYHERLVNPVSPDIHGIEVQSKNSEENLFQIFCIRKHKDGDENKGEIKCSL